MESVHPFKPLTGRHACPLTELVEDSPSAHTSCLVPAEISEVSSIWCWGLLVVYLLGSQAWLWQLQQVSLWHPYLIGHLMRQTFMRDRARTFIL